MCHEYVGNPLAYTHRAVHTLSRRLAGRQFAFSGTRTPRAVRLQAHARTVDLPRLGLVVKDKRQHAAVRHADRRYARLLQQLPSSPPKLTLALSTPAPTLE